MANPYFITGPVSSTVTSDQIVFTGVVSCSISADIVDLEGSVTLSSITMKNTVLTPAANQVIALATITDACGVTGHAVFTATATNIDETLTATTPGQSVITQFKTSNSPVWLLNNSGTVAQTSSTLVTVPQTPGSTDPSGVAPVTGSGLSDGFILSFPTYTTGERLGGLSDLSGLYLYYQFGDGTNRGPLSFYNISGSELSNWTTNLIGTSGNATLTLSGGVFDASNTNPAYNRVEAQLSAYNYLGASELSNYVSDIPTNGAPPDISGLSGVNYALNASGDVEVVLSMTINEGDPDQLTQSLLFEVSGTDLSGIYNITSPSGQLELSLNVGTNPTVSPSVTLLGTGALTQGQAYIYKVTPYSDPATSGVAGNTSVVSVTSTNVPAAATADTTLGALTYNTATNTLYNPDVDCSFAILLDTSSNYETYTGYTAVPTGSITFTPSGGGTPVTVASNALTFGATTATTISYEQLSQGITYSAVINLANTDGTNVSGLTTSGGTPTPNPSAITDLVIVSTTSGGGDPVEQVSYTDPNTQYYTNEKTYYVLSDSANIVLISGDLTDGSGAQTFNIGTGEDVSYALTNDTLYYLSLYPSSTEYPAPTVTDLPETSGSFITNPDIPADASAAMLGCLQNVTYGESDTSGTDCIVNVYVQADASYVIALDQDPSGQTTTYSSSTGIIQVAASSLTGNPGVFTAGTKYANIIQVRAYAKDGDGNAEYGTLRTFDSYALATAYLYTGATQPPDSSNGDWLTTNSTDPSGLQFIYKVWNGGYDISSGIFNSDIQAVNGSTVGLPTKWLVDALILVHPDGSGNALIDIDLTNPATTNYRTASSSITSVTVAKNGTSGVTTYTIDTNIPLAATVPSIGTTNNNCGNDAQIKEINPN